MSKARRRATKKERVQNIPATKRAGRALGQRLRAQFEQQERDIALARARIGATSEERCRWLLDEFASRDPDTLATGERATVRDNLHALAEGLPVDDPVIGGTRVFPPTGPRPYDASGRLGPALDETDLRSVWTQVLALTRAHHQPVRLPKIEETLWAPGLVPRGSKRRIRLIRHHDRWPDFTSAVLHQAAELLVRVAESGRLGECPECGELFVARRRQERHPKCARTARDARRPSRQPKSKKGA